MRAKEECAYCPYNRRQTKSWENSDAHKILSRICVDSGRRDCDSRVCTVAFQEQRAHALVIDGDTFFSNRRQQLTALTVHHTMPAIYAFREFPDAGGLMSYGASNVDADRLGGTYVGRILKGDKPPDLPVQQAVKVELIINLITAKVLGITLPPTLLARADEVIE